MKIPKLDMYEKTMVWAIGMWWTSIASMVLSLFRVHYLDSSQPILFWIGLGIGIIACSLYVSDTYKGTLLYRVMDTSGFYFIWSAVFCAVVGLGMAMSGVDCGKDHSEYRYSVSKKEWGDK